MATSSEAPQSDFFGSIDPVPYIEPGEIDRGAADDIVVARVNDIIDKADSLYSQAEQYVNNLVSVANQQQWPNVASDYYTNQVANVGELSLENPPTSPSLSTYTEAGLPIIPAMEDYPTLTFPDAPVDSSTPVTPSWDAPPTFQDLSFNQSAPTISDVTFPDKPFNLNDLPVMPSINFNQAMSLVPASPVVDIPVWDGVEPVDNLVPPLNVFSFHEVTYTSALNTAIGAKILSDIISGGRGYDSTFEDAVFARATERLRLEYDKKYNMILNTPLGYTRPPGSMMSELRQLAFEHQKALDEQNNMIVENQLKLALANTHFMIQNGIAYEQMLMNYANEVQNRAFQAAVQTVQLGVLAFNAQLETYKTKWQGLAIKASVYESRIRAAGLVLQKHLQELQAAKTVADIQTQELEAYKTSLAVYDLLERLYIADLSAVQTKVEVEKIRVEAFKAQLDAFTARVQYEIARMNLWQAKISGEQTKVQAYGEQVRAYLGKVQAYEATVNAKLAQVNTVSEKNKIYLGQYSAEVDMWKTKTSALLSKNENLIKEFAAEVSLWESTGRIRAFNQENMIKFQDVQMRNAQAKAATQLDAARLAVDELYKKLGLMVEAVKAGATITGQLASSIYTAMQVHASVQTQVSFGQHNQNSHSYHLQNSGSEGAQWIYSSSKS